VSLCACVVTSPCMAPELCVVVCVQRQHAGDVHTHAVRACMGGGARERAWRVMETCWVRVAVLVVTSPCMAPESCVVVCVQRQHAGDVHTRPARARMDSGGRERATMVVEFQRWVSLCRRVVMSPLWCQRRCVALCMQRQHAVDVHIRVVRACRDGGSVSLCGR
jgi:hypothetical protein